MMGFRWQGEKGKKSLDTVSFCPLICFPATTKHQAVMDFETRGPWFFPTLAKVYPALCSVVFLTAAFIMGPRKIAVVEKKG